MSNGEIGALRAQVWLLERAVETLKAALVELSTQVHKLQDERRKDNG